MAQPRMHPNQFPDGAIDQGLGARLRSRTSGSPGLLQGIDGPREIAEMVIRQSQVGEQSRPPTGARILRQESIEDPKIVRAGLALVGLDGPAQGVVLVGGR